MAISALSACEKRDDATTGQIGQTQAQTEYQQKLAQYSADHSAWTDKERLRQDQCGKIAEAQTYVNQAYKGIVSDAPASAAAVENCFEKYSSNSDIAACMIAPCTLIQMGLGDNREHTCVEVADKFSSITADQAKIDNAKNETCCPGIVSNVLPWRSSSSPACTVPPEPQPPAPIG